MFKFFKKHKNIALLGSLITFSLTSTILASVAWFQVEGRDQISDIRIPSGVVANYFEGKKITQGGETTYDFGTGTSEKPFIIARPEQLFNLMELMKSDNAKMTSESSVFYLNSYYFQFGIDYGSGPMFYDYTDEGTLANNSETPTSKTLNMKYYSDRGMLSPIGSPSHPFTGHIEGYNLTIDNITINGTDCSDVGVFGYVASPGSISNVYFDHLKIDIGISDLTGQSSGTHAEHTHTNNANVGYIVGHVYDANSALSNVYVNNCSIANQSAGNKAVSNNFGYIGKSDTNEIIGDSSQTDIQLKASSLHNYLSSNYNSIKDFNYSTSTSTSDPSTAQSATRDAGYNGSGKVSTKIGVSGSNYTFSGPSNATTLATAGYTSDEIVLKDVRYEKNASTETYERLSPSTQVLSDVPDVNSLSDGYYIYYDSDKNGTSESKWQYLEVISSQGIVTTIQMNCFYMTYTSGGNKYYMTYNNGNLVGTNVEPASASADQRPNYYFCLRQSAGSYGISSYSTSNAQTEFHLYSPASDKYVNASTSGVSSNFTFINNFSSSLNFVQQGNGTAISVSGNDQYAFLVNGTSITLKRYVSTDGEKSLITFEGLDEPEAQTSYASDYDLVTDASTLTAGDIITFVRNDSGTYRAIADQAKNNRLTTVVTLSNSNTRITASNATTLSSFILEGNSSKWEFRDLNTNQYLYAAGQKSSGANYLRSQDTNDTKGHWTISLNGSNEATVQSVGNSYVPYLDFVSGSNNEGPYHIFRAFRSAASKPLIFRRSQLTNDPTYIYSSFKYDVTTTSSSEPIKRYYNLRCDIPGQTIDSSDPLVSDSAAVFLISTSQVALLNQDSHSYELVTNVSELTTGTQVIVACNTQNATAYYDSDVSTEWLLKGTSTFTSNKLKVSSLYSGTQLFTIHVTSSGKYAFTDSSTISSSTSFLTKYGVGSDNKVKFYDCYNSISSIDSADDEELWTISITDGNATITNCEYTSYTLQYNSNTGQERFSCYKTSQKAIQLYKVVERPSEPETTYIGDQIGDGYNPNYIDVVGGFTSSNTSMTFASSSAIAAPTINNKFYNSTYSASSLVFAEYNGSMDLGRIDIEYSQSANNSLKVNKGGSSLKSVEGDLSIVNDGDSTDHVNTLYITTNNIHNYALCALNSEGTVVATFAGNGTISGSIANAKYYVIDFRASGGSVSISRIAYSFTQLPGNNGNFGHVGYRSADYTSSTYTDGVWTQTTPTHATTTTILNYYFNTEAGVYSYIYVEFDYANMRYNITAYCTVNSELYLFNYDPTVYTVYVNGMKVLAGSNIVHVNATQYDFETGWAT